MTLSKVIRAQEGIPRSHSCVEALCCLPPKKYEKGLNTCFLAASTPGALDRCCIGNRPLHFLDTTLSKVISRAQEGIPMTQSVSQGKKAAWTCQKMFKIIPNIARSALAGGPKDVTLAMNHSIFFKWFWVKLSGLKRRFPDHKMAPSQRSGLNWPENV